MAPSGYARTSTTGSDAAPLLDARAAAGVEHPFENRGLSEVQAEQWGLSHALALLRGGATRVVGRSDRLGRSTTHLLQTVGELAGRGIGVRSRAEGSDTTARPDRLIIPIIGTSGQFERDPNPGRAGAGVRSAAAGGRKDRRAVVATPEKVARSRVLIECGPVVPEEVARVRIARSAPHAALSFVPSRDDLPG